MKITKKDLEILTKSAKNTPLNSIFNPTKIKVDDTNLHLNIDTQKDIILLRKFIDNIDS